MTTLADVAKRAGVSLSTASYVMSGKRPITTATRERVLAAMDELGFQPNNQGRALASGKSRTVALLFPAQNAMLSTMPLEFVISAAATSEQRGYALVVSITGEADEQMLSMLERGFVDGYILMEIELVDARVEMLKERGLPFAMIGHCADNDGLNYVDLDFDHAITEAIEYLARLGHHDFAFVDREAGDPDSGYGLSIRSQAAFDRELAARGLTGRTYHCNATPQAGAETFDEILNQQPQVTAVISINAEATSGVLRGAADRGVSIPDELSVLGVLSPRTGELLVPPLTTVDFPAEEMGRDGVNFLIDALEGGAKRPQQRLYKPGITVRASTGPARVFAARS